MIDTLPIIKPTEGYNYYHDLTTWLSFEAIARALNTKISGDPSRNWVDFLQRAYPKFSHCLSFNCGNGWVERELFNKGVIGAVTGTDIADQSLSAARTDAEVIRMPATYLNIDINKDHLPKECFDIVLNHAALHHVAKIDFVLRQVCTILPEDGVFVSYDYTGPHRNQYDFDTWSKIVEFNDWQAPDLQNTNLCYPHLPTMLDMDPSEGIHSELILDHINRYFKVEHSVALGGSFAYQLLHDHANLNSRKHTSEGRALVNKILAIDEELTGNDIKRSFFTFLVLRPNKASLNDEGQLARWTEEEETREHQAAANGGRYYPKTALEIICNELAMARYLLKLRTGQS